MAEGIRVLYVDDEPSLLEIAQMFLEQQSEFTVETATSAKVALDSPSIESYDVIISDYQMPGINGIAFLKTVRERFGDLPFILFTGRGREEIVIEAINNGVDFYIQKGGDVESQFAELALKIRQVVSRRRAERLRTESEKRLLDIINFLPDATFAIDRAGRVIAWNRAMEEMTGRSSEQIMGQGDYEYAIPFYDMRRPILIDLVFEPQDEVRQKYSYVRADKRGLTAETTNATPRGKTCVLWGRAAPLINSEGVTIGAIESIRDITESKTAEDNLARSKDYLDQIFSSVQAGIVIIDLQTHQIVDINAAGTAMIGLPKEQIIGNTCHKFICPAETGQCPITDLHKNVDNAERMLITGNGEKIPIIKYVTRTTLDGRECLLETFIDNSERRRAEDALRKSEEKYRLLTEVTDDVIYMVDLQGTVNHISPQISRYGYKQEEVLSHNFTEFIADEDISNVITDFKHAVSTKTQTISTIRIRDKTGDLHWMEDNGAPVIDASGSVVAISGILRNITARKQAEDAQKESEEKFRSIFENSPYPVAINSLPDNKFLEVNKAFLDISGYTPEEILGKDPMEMGFLPLTEALRLVSHRLLTGKIENVPLAVTAKDGKRIHVLFSTMPVTIHNKPALVTVTAEVTKLKRVEEELLQKNEDLNAAYEELTATDEELRQNYDEMSKKEAVLRESEEKFRVLVELSLDGIIITDFKGTLLFANRAAGLIVDAPDTTTMIGQKNVMDFVAPESRAKVIWDFGRVALGIDAYLVNYKLITATRREVWVECIGKKIPFEGSSAMLVSMRDVTTRKLAEEQVRESEVKFSTVFRSSPVSLTLVSAIDGIFVDVNDAFLTYTGYSRDEVIGRRADDVGIFADTSESQRFASALRTQRTVHGMDLKCRIKSGEIRACRFSSGIILMGEKPHILSTVEDITERKKTEDALRQSEEKFRALVEHSLDGILILDPHGKILFANHSAGKIIDDENFHDLIGARNVMEFIAPESHADVIRDFSRVATGVDGYLAQYKLTTVHQEERWVESMGKSIIFDGAAAILISLRDITERVITQSALQTIVASMVGTTGLNSLQKIAENISSWLGADCVMVGEIQPDNQTVKVLSMQLDGKAVEDFSYTLKGTPCENVAEKGFCHYPDDAIRLFPKSRDLVELNIRGYIGTPLKNSDGKVIGILCALFRNPFQSSPTVQEIMATIAVKAGAEIERSQIERALKESELLFREVFDNANDAVFLVEPAKDGPGRYLLVNNRSVQMLGYSKEELLEMSPRDIVPGDVAKKIMPDVKKRLVRDGHATFESENRQKDGTIIPIEVSIRSFRYKGRDVDLSIVRDITERKRDLEALRQANKKLNILSGITRHDIKNQILALNGFAAILHQNIPDPSFETYFSRITNTSNQITNMIQFTKEYEQIGVQAPTWQDIRNLVDAAARDVALDHVTLKNDLPASTEIFADPLIAKVIFNLIDNALRHGGEISTLRFALEERDGNWIIVCEDDGDGVPRDEKEIIFDLGYGKNTGFGLAISREILDITGITIKETGEPGKGARFEITVPKNQFKSVS